MIDRVGGRYYSNFYFHIGYPIGKNNYEGRGLTFAALIASNTLQPEMCVFRTFFFFSSTILILPSILSPSGSFVNSNAIAETVCNLEDYT